MGRNEIHHGINPNNREYIESAIIDLSEDGASPTESEIVEKAVYLFMLKNPAPTRYQFEITKRTIYFTRMLKLIREEEAEEEYNTGYLNTWQKKGDNR